MQFASYEFILFIALLFVTYYLVPKKLQWPLLLVASLVFYAIASPWYLLYIGVTGLTAFFSGILMGRLDSSCSSYLKENKASLTKDQRKGYKSRIKSKKKAIMLGFVLLNLIILGVTKYTSFVLSNISLLLKTELAIPNILVPMGISFYTFQVVAYMIDVYRGTATPEKNVFKFLLFTTYFPQLIQGPISRWNDLSKTLFGEHSFRLEEFSSGLIRVLWGFFKKLVLADRVLIGLKTLLAEPLEYQGLYVLVVMLFYSLQLYADFTGGIDITIGISEALGIKVQENFNLPYFSRNIKDYWNRWHMSMGNWFTDYIFYPLSVSPSMLKLTKKTKERCGSFLGKRISIYISCFIVWLTTGLWHGATWGFVTWGLMNYVVIMISQELEPLYKLFNDKFNLREKSFYMWFEIFRTFLLMSSLKLFDCYKTPKLTFQMFASLFSKSTPNIFRDGSLLSLGLEWSDYGVLIVGIILMFLVSLYKLKKGKDIRNAIIGNEWLRLITLSVLIIVIIVFGIYGVGYDKTSFIYNQF